MAAMVSAVHSSNGMDGNILVPPDGLVKLKDKVTPVIEQVGVPAQPWLELDCTRDMTLPLVLLLCKPNLYTCTEYSVLC